MGSLRWPVLALGGMVLIIIALGLWQTGGPAQGAKERRDETRVNDLFRLQASVRCLALRGSAVIATPDCTEGLRLADPYTDQPYALSTPAPGRFRLCATLEAPQAVPGWRDLRIIDGQSCLEGDLPD